MDKKKAFFTFHTVLLFPVLFVLISNVIAAKNIPTLESYDNELLKLVVQTEKNSLIVAVAQDLGIHGEYLTKFPGYSLVMILLMVLCLAMIWNLLRNNFGQYKHMFSAVCCAFVVATIGAFDSDIKKKKIYIPLKTETRQSFAPYLKAPVLEERSTRFTWAEKTMVFTKKNKEIE